MNMRFTDRIGEKFVSNEGYSFIIVEYNSSTDVVIEFQDKYKARIPTRYDVCQRGSIKNPYHPSVHGHGMLGIMSDGSKPKTSHRNGYPTKQYSAWHGMIARCYSNYERYHTYDNTIVCDRWLVFSNFLEDLPLIEGYELWLNNSNQAITLDKDLKQQEVKNKVYSLETCCFVTQSDNTKEMHSRNIQGKNIQGKNIETGEYTRIFNSIREAEREMKMSHGCINRCLNGIYKQTGGYIWYKVDDKHE